MLRPTLEDRKIFLAEVAAKIFAQKGYKTASLQDVAEKADISKAGVYHYFKTKEDILFYLIKIKHDKFLEALKVCIKECRDNELDPEKTFQKLFYTYANFINSEKDLRLIVLHDRHQLTGENKKRLKVIEREVFRTLRDQITTIPNIKKHYDPNVISFLVISMSHWMGSWLKEDGKLTQDDAIQQAIDIILYGAIEQ